jgi:hypothetical protein
MSIKVRFMRVLIVMATAALAFQATDASANKSKSTTAVSSGNAAAAAPGPADVGDARKTLESAADALGMLRTAGLGGGRTPRLDVINTMEFWANGTPFSDYHVVLAFNPPGMRIELTNANNNPQHAIEVVNGKYAWNESEVGAGLVPGKGTAMPMEMTDKVRLLRLWILPYGVVKAGLAAGDKAKVSTENGATVVTFPLTGELAGVTVKATLDDKNFVSKVETQGPGNLSTETEYSDYADRGDIPTDVQFPGHIVRKQGGKTVVDLTVKKADGNNPYVVIPIPDSVVNASHN